MIGRARSPILLLVSWARSWEAISSAFCSTLTRSTNLDQGDFSIPALLVSLGGAVSLLVISKLFRRIAWSA